MYAFFIYLSNDNKRVRFFVVLTIIRGYEVIRGKYIWTAANLL